MCSAARQKSILSSVSLLFHYFPYFVSHFAYTTFISYSVLCVTIYCREFRIHNPSHRSAVLDMDVLSYTLAGWATLVCFVMTTVNGCLQNDYSATTARQVVVNASTHVPVYTLSARSLLWCVDICSRAGQ